MPGETLEGIADQLNKDGIPTPTAFDEVLSNGGRMVPAMRQTVSAQLQEISLSPGEYGIALGSHIFTFGVQK